MIDLRNVSSDVWHYALMHTNSKQNMAELYNDIMAKLYEIEREDDKDGTNELERLLEEHDVAWFVEEYGLA